MEQSLLVIDDSILLKDRWASFDPKCQLLCTGEISFADTMDALEKVASGLQKISHIFLNGDLGFANEKGHGARDGIELFKHIRLTRALGPLRLLPVIIETGLPLEHYLRRSEDNLLLLESRCSLLRLPATHEQITSFLQNAIPYESEEQLRRGLHSKVILSNSERADNNHALRNQVGAFKYLAELDIIDASSQQLYQSHIRTSLSFKKAEFLNLLEEHDPRESNVDPVDCASLKQCRALYVDDEHDRGWSRILHELLYQGSAGRFDLDSSDRVVTAERKFTVIRSLEAAQAQLEEFAGRDSSAVAEWRAHEDRLCTAENDRKKAKEEFDRYCKEYADLGKKIEVNRSNYSQIIEKLGQREGELKEHSIILNQRFEDVLTNLECKPLAEDALLQTEIQTAAKIIKDYQNIVLERSRCEESYEHLVASQQICEKNKSEADEQQRKSVKSSTESRNHAEDAAADLGNSFHFDIVFLDLNFHQSDSSSTREDSGLDLLNKIKTLNPSIPVVLFTAVDSAMSHQKAQEYGADGYWIKGASSLRELRTLVLQLTRRAREERQRWTMLKQAKAKKSCFGYVATNYGLELVELQDIQREQINRHLVQSFWLLQHVDSAEVMFSENIDSRKYVALNMGCVQEIRYKDIEGEKWKNLAHKRVIPEDESVIRRIRNDAAHQDSRAISSTDAVLVFDLTLKQILQTGRTPR